MQRGLSRRESVLLGLLHVISLVAVASTAPAVDGGRGRGPTRLRRSSTAEPTSNDQNNVGPEVVEDADEICRCAADQWEGVLRSVDRAFYLSGEQPAGQRLRAAELESNTAIHYDFRNGLFASHDFDTGTSTVIDYNMVPTNVILFKQIRYVCSDLTCIRTLTETMCTLQMFALLTAHKAMWYIILVVSVCLCVCQTITFEGLDVGSYICTCGIIHGIRFEFV